MKTPSKFRAKGIGASSKAKPKRHPSEIAMENLPKRELVVTIKDLGAQGDGISLDPETGQTLFVSRVLAGETVRVEARGDRAEPVDIVTASLDRADPACGHYGECGGCSLQHMTQTAYATFKQKTLKELLAREGLETEILPIRHTAQGRRRRMTVHARQTGKDKGRPIVQLGFKARRSWRLVSLSECVVADPRLVENLPRLKDLAVLLFEHPASAPSLHLTWTLTGLDVDITGVEAKSGGLSLDARMAVAEVADRHRFARVSLNGEVLYQAQQPLVAFGQAKVPIPTGAFLQAAQDAEQTMADLIRQALTGRGYRQAADLFCGAGSFTFPLAEIATVMAADSSEGSIQALRAGVASAPGLRPIRAEVRDLFRRPFTADELRTQDAIVFDPPRAGAIDQVRHLAKARAETVVGISCNPSTFVRDAKELILGGYRLESLTPIDQFLYSPHLELVGVFRR